MACTVGGSYAAMPEDRVDELALLHGIAFRDPADLTFADCMHGLVTLRSFGNHPQPIGIRGSPRCVFLMNRWPCSIMLFK